MFLDFCVVPGHLTEVFIKGILVMPQNHASHTFGRFIFHF